MEATLDSRNRATIPKAVREHLHLKPDDRITFLIQPDGRVAISKLVLTGSVPKPRRSASIKEMDAGS